MERNSTRLSQRALADPQTRYLMNIQNEIALELELNEQLIADEKSLKEAAILREEETIQRLASSVKKMKEMGLPLVEIAHTIGLSEIEVNDLLKR